MLVRATTETRRRKYHLNTPCGKNRFSSLMHVARCVGHYTAAFQWEKAASCYKAVRLIHLKQRILSQTQPSKLLLVQGIGFPLTAYQDDGRRKVPERTNADTKRKNKHDKTREMSYYPVQFSAK